MRWKRGDKCVFNEAVVRTIIKPICEESLRNSREPGHYFVVAVSEDQTVAVIVGRDNRLMGVLTEWLLHFEEPAWREILEAVAQSSTPTDLVGRLRRRESA